MSKSNRTVLFAVVLLVAALFVSACQGVASIPEYEIKAKDYSYEAPQEMQAGWVRIHLINEGQKPHHVQFLRLKDGVTLEQFQAALQKGEMDALPLVNFYGGVGVESPSAQGTVEVNLTEGQYVLACFVSDEDQIPHLAKGMIMPVKVVAGKAQTAAQTPNPDVTVNMKDFTFDMPTEVKAGKSTWEIINNGPEPHEMALVKLDEGKTLQDVVAAMQSNPMVPPDFVQDAGGMQAIDSGMTGYMEADMTPGNYIALCFVPDPASGKPHIELGMMMPFVVK